MTEGGKGREEERALGGRWQHRQQAEDSLDSLRPAVGTPSADADAGTAGAGGVGTAAPLSSEVPSRY